ncbi:MAG: transposase [Gammaproteobacteria bacterium]|jgi:transposase
MNRLHDHLMEQTVLHMDETPVQVLKEPDRTPQSTSYMWVITSAQSSVQPVILFHYAPSRSAEIPKDRLADYQGALVVDGYEGYQRVCNDNHLTRLGCWAHARRKFIEAQRLQPKCKPGKADKALTYIQKLYAIEKHNKDQPPDKRHAIRQQAAKPILDQLRIWLQKRLPGTPPKTALGKAMFYLDKQWPRLIGYLDDEHYPIDNNRAENDIRPFVIGRKNWLFSTSQNGAKASANLYSLIETAKANQLEPYAYLKQVFSQLPNVETIEDVDQLLPWNATL